MPKSDEEWVRDHVGPVVELGDLVSQVAPDIHHDYGPHTGLKLGSLEYAVDLFTSVARSQVDKKPYFDGSVYVDLCAGCGVNRVPGQGDYVAGSPIIAARTTKPFDKLVCVEKDQHFASTLRDRLELVDGPAAEVVNGDANESVPQIIDRVGFENPLVFTFVDPEGMEIDWSTLESLSEEYNKMDFLINLTAGADRELAAAHQTDKSPDRVESFAGMSLQEILGDYNGSVPDAYEAQVREVLGKPYGRTALVTDEDNNPKYYLLMYARETSGGSPWREGYENLMDRVGRLTAQNVNGALNDIKGRGLNAFIEEE